MCRLVFQPNGFSIECKRLILIKGIIEMVGMSAGQIERSESKRVRSGLFSPIKYREHRLAFVLMQKENARLLVLGSVCHEVQWYRSSAKLGHLQEVTVGDQSQSFRLTT